MPTAKTACYLRNQAGATVKTSLTIPQIERLRTMVLAVMPKNDPALYEGTCYVLPVEVLNT